MNKEMNKMIFDAIKSQIILNKDGGSVRIKSLIEIDCYGEVKPALMVINAYPKYLDGWGYMIVNPDNDLIDRFKPGVAISSALMKEIVMKKCDVAVMIVATVGKIDDIYPTMTYRTRNPQPPKYTLFH